MKKIFASLVFLLLMAISSNSFADYCGPAGTNLSCDTDATLGNCVAAGCTEPTSTTATECEGTGPDNCGEATESQCKSYTKCSWNVIGNSDQNAFAETLCNALKIVTGTGGKTFAAFAIISVGIGFFTGKVSWGLMIGITAGIAAMFGAPTIVSAITGTSTKDCGAIN